MASSASSSIRATLTQHQKLIIREAARRLYGYTDISGGKKSILQDALHGEDELHWNPTLDKRWTMKYARKKANEAGEKALEQAKEAKRGKKAAGKK